MKDSTRTRMATYDGTIDDRIEDKFIILHHSYRVVLEAIRDREWLENTFDSQWVTEIAEEILNG